jgi:small-conductance mechanosensitive channel
MAFSDITNWFLAVVKPLASNLVVAVVVLLIGIILARIVERVVLRILHELELDKWLRKAGLKFAMEQTVSHVVRYVIYFITVIAALNRVGLTSFVLNILAAGVIVLVIAAILLGVKDFIPNFMAGLRIHHRGFVKVGDVIRVRDLEGEVRQINLLDTRIKTVSGDLLFVPNSMLTKHEVLRHKRKKTMLK